MKIDKSQIIDLLKNRGDLGDKRRAAAGTAGWRARGSGGPSSRP